MGGAFGTDELKKSVVAIADVVNVGSSVIGGGFLSLLGLIGPLNTIRGINFQELRNELLELDPLERAEVEQAFVMKLNLANKTLEQKIADAAELLSQAVDIVEEGMKVYEDAKSLVLKFKALIGV